MSNIDAPQCAPHGLLAFLRARYGSPSALGTAWVSAIVAYEDLLALRPVPYESNCNLTCRTDLQRFVHDELLRRWVEVVTRAIRKVDPHHLIATPRLAIATRDKYRFFTPTSEPNADLWTDSPTNEVGTDHAEAIFCPYDLLARTGDTGFDLIAVNAYEGGENFDEPWFSAGMRKLHERAKLPIIISEFSVRAGIKGWSNKGGAGAFVTSADTIDDQVQRGDHYKRQIDQFTKLPFVLGAAWHAWSDRYLADNPDRQMNMGLVQCDDAVRGFTAGTRWTKVDEGIRETNCEIMTRIGRSTGL